MAQLCQGHIRSQLYTNNFFPAPTQLTARFFPFSELVPFLSDVQIRSDSVPLTITAFIRGYKYKSRQPHLPTKYEKINSYFQVLATMCILHK